MVNSKTTDENGTCTIEGVEEGTLTITVTKEGFVDKTETINVTEDTTVNIILEEETVESKGVDFSVLDDESNGVSGARITLTNTATEEVITNSNGGTGSSGGSKITLDYGTYNVEVTKDDYTPATFTLTVDDTLSVNGDNVIIGDEAPYTGNVVITLIEL